MNESNSEKFYDAIQEGDLETVKKIVQSGVNVNEEVILGFTPLNYATTCGDKVIAEYLISKGADVHGQDKEGDTPLHIAAFWGAKDIAEILLQKGADVNALNKSKTTPLHAAAGACDPLDTGKTLMATAIYFDEEAKKSIISIAKMLISKGANPNAQDVSGATPLHWAAQRNRVSIAELLISKGADINAKTKKLLFIIKGLTPLKIALDQGHKEMVDFLKRHGAN